MGHVPGRRDGWPGTIVALVLSGARLDHRDHDAADDPAPGGRRGAQVRRPGLARRGPGQARGRAARAAARRRTRLGLPARLRPGLRVGRDLTGRPRAAQRAARRLGIHRRPGRRHGPALAAAAPPGQPRRGRPGRDRRRARQGQDRRWRPARAELPGSDSRPGSEGGGLGSDRRRASCPTPPSAPLSAGSTQPTRTTCWRRSRPRFFDVVARRMARLGQRHGPVLRPASATRRPWSPRRRSTLPPATSTGPTRRRRCAGCSSEGRDDVARALRCRERDAQAGS